MFSFPIFKGLLALVVSIHACLTRSPLRRAHFAVLIHMLECLHQSQDFIYVSANGEVVVLHMSEGSLAVNDESRSEVYGIISVQASVVFADLLGKICQHGDLHATEATLVSGLVSELHVSEVGVD